MYLRKRSIIQLYYILIPLFFLIFMVQTTSSFADTETLITGRVVKDSNPNEGIPNIEVTAYIIQPITGIPSVTADTDPNGYYTIQVDALLTSTYDEQDFYVCAEDPNNVYVRECYEGYYYGAIEYSNLEELEEEVTLFHVKLNNPPYSGKNFRLQKGGNILATLNIPKDRPYTLSLEGEINFKKELDMRLPINIDDVPGPVSINNKLGENDNPLPQGNYIVKIASDDWFSYLLEIAKEETGEINHYYSVDIDTYNDILNQYHDHKSSAETADTIILTSDQPAQITFSSLSDAGMIYGIITDPNMGEISSTNISDAYENNIDGKSIVEYSEMDDLISYTQYYEHPAVENVYLKIIPLDGQYVAEPEIPSQIWGNLALEYHTGAYGGYAFKFLEPTGEYKIQLLRRAGNTDILNFYYKDANSVTHDPDQAGKISLSSAEKIKKVNITMPSKVYIHGFLHENDANGNDLGPIRMVSIDLMTRDRERITGTSVNYICEGPDPNYNAECAADPDCWSNNPDCESEFFFEELICGDFYIRITKENYNVLLIPLDNVQLGDEIWLGDENNILYLDPYEPCGGNKRIEGRIFIEEDPDIGLENIIVRALDIEHISGFDDCLMDITDPNGRYCISGLPDSLYMLYTRYDPNIVSIAGDPNIIKGGYYNEMYKNVTLFYDTTKFNPEIQMMTSMKNNFDPSNIDPNIPATLIGFDEGQDVANINMGLSSHIYHFPKGLHIFAYPGTPPIDYAGTSKKIITKFSYKSKPKIMSFITDENKWEITYRDPTSGQIKGNDFPIKAGQGYFLYLYEDTYAQLPPFTIVTPTFDMIQGLNFISLPDSFEKKYYSQNMISDLGGEEGNAYSINRYKNQSGKWKSTNCLWGLPAGDNAKFERHHGYLVYMKSPNQWP